MNRFFLRITAFALALMLLAGSCSFAEQDALPEILFSAEETAAETEIFPEELPTDEAAAETEIFPEELPAEEPLDSEHETEAAPTPAAEPTPEAAMEVITEASMEVPAEPTPEAAAEATAEPGAGPTPAPSPEPTAEAAEAAPDAAIEATAEPAALLPAESVPETIAEGVTEIILPAELYLEVGEMARILPEILPAGEKTRLTYSAYPVSHLALHGDGYLLAKEQGMVELRVTAENGVEAVCTVYIGPAGVQEYTNYSYIGLPADIYVYLDEAYQISPSISPEGANAPIFYDSSDPSIASVDGSGRLTPKRTGSITLSLTYQNGAFRMNTTRATVHVLSRELPFEIEDGVLKKYSGQGGDIVIPDGVTAIADGVFHIDTPNPITSVSIPDSVVSIGNHAFSNLDKVEYFHLPAGLTSIGDFAFYQCTSATFPDLPAGLTELGQYAFADTKIAKATIPASLKEIGGKAFYSTAIQSVHIPGTVEIIGNGAFDSCSLTELTIESGVKKIGNHAFSGNNLTRLSVPGTVESVGEFAFSHSYDMQEIVFAEGLKSIGEQVFYGGNADMKIYLPRSLTEIPDYAFPSYSFYSECIVYADSAAWLHCAQNGVKHSLADDLSEEDSYLIYDGVFMGYYGNSKHMVIPEGPTSISPHARIPRDIESISFPGSIKLIPDYLLDNFAGLTSVTFHEGLEGIGYQAFGQCRKLKELRLPNSLKYISDDAFYYCEGLERVYLGTGLESIGHMAFYGVTANFYVIAGSAAEDICKNMGVAYFTVDDFDNPSDFQIRDGVLTAYLGTDTHVVVPDGVSSIAQFAFRDNNSMVSIQLPDGLTSIGTYAFYKADALESISIPDSVNSIESYAFYGCSSLKQVKLPAGISHIPDYCFEQCLALEAISIPAGVKIIGFAAFRNCESMKSAALPDGLERIELSAFSSCASLERISIPNSVTALGAYAFTGCTSLRSITLSKQLPSLEYRTFVGCTSLESVTIPNGMKEISSTVFQDCTSLKDLYIPASVKTISEYAIRNCPKLIVRCAEDSTAEKHCKKYNIPYTTSGVNPNMLKFAEESALIGVNQTAQLTVIVDTEAAMGSVKFKSSNAKVVSVDSASGEITGKRAGTATITATSENGLKASCKVTVKAAPKSVAFAEENIILTLGESIQLSCVLPKNTAAGLSYEANNFFVLSVTPDGLLTGVGTGTADVVVTTHNGKTASCTVTVVTPPDRIYLNKSALTIRQTTTEQIIPSVNEGSHCSKYSFVSSDPSIATVDDQGNVSGISKGTATITVTTHNGISAECSVTVIAPPPRMEIPEELKLGLKESAQIIPEYIFEEGPYTGAYSYAIKNTKIASVDENGMITAKKVGSTTLAVSTEDGISANCKITVLKAPTSIKLSPAKGELGVGEPAAFSWTLSKSSHSAIRFSSSDPAVLEVDPDGTIHAKAPGIVTVTAATFNGKKATSEIRVYPAPTSVEFVTRDGDDWIHVCEGQTATLEVLLSEGSYGGYSFSVDDTSSVQLDAKTGKFRVISDESTFATVSTYNGLTDRVLICVEKPVKKITLPAASATLSVGDSYTLKPDVGLNYYGNHNFSYKSSSTKVATVDQNGVVSARGVGSATITVTSFNGKTAKLKLTVKKAPEQIRLNADSLYLGSGETFQLAPEFYPKNSGAAVRYESSNPSVLRVSDEGLVTASQSYGIAFITATTSNGLSATCQVTLGKAPQGLQIIPDSATLCVGMKLPIGLSIGNGSYCSTFLVGSTNPKVADINSRGEVVAYRKGEAEIIVETYNGRRDNMPVTVVAAPSKFKLDLPDTLQLGNSYNLLNHFSSNPAMDPALLIDSVKLSNDRAMLLENELGIFLIPMETGNITLTLKTCTGRSLRVKLKIEDTQNPILPAIQSPMRMNASQKDFIGNWKLECVNSAGIAFSPEAIGIGEWEIGVTDLYWTPVIDGYAVSGTYHIEEGVLISYLQGSYFYSTMHENGMLRLLIADGVEMWFSRQ